MGDLIMSGPAIRALKETFNAKITVLTSSMGKAVVKLMPEIDEAIIFDTPWVKTEKIATDDHIYRVVKAIKRRRFDAAVVFSVYSQNPLPNAMLAYMAGIPRALAYCRENPYGLLTNWVPDKEPYSFIKHQVRRDLDLVKTIGAVPSCEGLCLSIDHDLKKIVYQKLTQAGVLTDQPWLILHPGVSEVKRQYPVEGWIDTGKQLINEMGYQVLLTGSASERQLTSQIQIGIGERSFSVAGLFDIEQFSCLVKNSPTMISVNTGSVHIAAAMGTPVVVLYAQTNPQHTPWGVSCRVLQFPVAEELCSKNEVIRFVNNKIYDQPIEMPGPKQIVNAVKELLDRACGSSLQFHGTLKENQEIAAS
jgi:lipopolysaccharide heptosyltransferase II